MYFDLKIEILKKFSTQSDFAMALREHESKISAVIRGRRKLTPEQAQRWQEVLNCDPEILATVTQ